jgi:tetratricopeptide (TPR) repeat protein
VSAARDRRRRARNYSVLARQCADGHRFEEALSHLAKARQLDPANRDIRQATATIYYATGDLAAAERELTSLYSSPGCDAITCALLGNVHLARDEAARALELYREAASLGGDGRELSYNRGLARYLTADLDGAQAEFMAALDFDPGHARAMDGLGCVEQARGNGERAVTWFESAAQADGSLCDVQEHLGEALFESGVLERAERHLERAAALDPARAEPQRLLGEIHAAREEWRAALLHWQRAVEAAPAPPARQTPGKDEALRGMARACMALDRPHDAKRYLEESLEANPGNVRACLDLGTLCLRVGERRRALEHLRRAQHLAGDDPQIARLIARALRPES